MPTQIDKDALTILGVLADAPRDVYIEAQQLFEKTGLDPGRIDDAVALLVESGYAEWLQTMGTAPFHFADVAITPRGRYEYQRTRETLAARQVAIPQPIGANLCDSMLPARPPVPVGSPYGFRDEDWEIVAERRSRAQMLYAVLGYQFESSHYDSDCLRTNVQQMLNSAVDEYNLRGLTSPIELDYQPLRAGYGEHLFNEIVRDIISADIAVFDTSDLNPNVMLEMGVALTWGVRVLPIKAVGRPKPPSDVSGQTWADYHNSGAEFVDPDHLTKLVRMIERALRKKGRGETTLRRAGR